MEESEKKKAEQVKLANEFAYARDHEDGSATTLGRRSGPKDSMPGVTQGLHACHQHKKRPRLGEQDTKALDGKDPAPEETNLFKTGPKQVFCFVRVM